MLYFTYKNGNTEIKKNDRNLSNVHMGYNWMSLLSLGLTTDDIKRSYRITIRSWIILKMVIVIWQHVRIDVSPSVFFTDEQINTVRQTGVRNGGLICTTVFS